MKQIRKKLSANLRSVVLEGYNVLQSVVHIECLGVLSTVVCIVYADKKQLL